MSPKVFPLPFTKLPKIKKVQKVRYDTPPLMHKPLIFKMRQNGVSGRLLKLFLNYLNNRKQHVVLNVFQLITLLSNLVSLKALFLVPYYFSFTSMNLREILDLMWYPVISCDICKRIESWFKSHKSVDLSMEDGVQPCKLLFSCKKNNPNHPSLFFNGTVL